MDTTTLAPAVATEEALHWQRLHPATPLIRTWTSLTAGLVALVWIFTDIGDPAETMSTAGDYLAWVVLGAAAIVLVLAGYMYVAWRMMSYAVDDEAAHMRSGVLFRTKRHAQLDRIQAIDIRQPVLARLSGLAELTLEVAGGADSQVKIGFLREAEAQRLRAELLAKAAGIKLAPAGSTTSPQPGAALAQSGETGFAQGQAPSSDGDAPGTAPATRARTPLVAPEAPEQEILVVPPGRLIGSALLSVGIALTVLFMLAMIVVAVFEPGALFTMVPAVLGAGTVVYGRFAAEFNFRMAISPDGIRVRRGLLETRAQTIPPGRIQAVQISQGPLWRRLDWWRVRVTVAGYAQEDASNQSQSVLLPVGSRAEAYAALSLVLPDLGTPDPLAVLDAGLTGRSDKKTGESVDAFTPNPRRTRIIHWFTWSRGGFAVTDRALLIRDGRWYRYLQVVPHERTQSLCVKQGPLYRWLRIANFVAHVPAGPVAPVLGGVDQDVAQRLIEEQAARARAARATDRSERWMQARAPEEPAPVPPPEPTAPEHGSGGTVA